MKKKFFFFKKDAKIIVLSHIFTFPSTWLTRSGESIEKGERPDKRRQRLKSRIISTSLDFNTVDKNRGNDLCLSVSENAIIGDKIFPYL